MSMLHANVTRFAASGLLVIGLAACGGSEPDAAATAAPPSAGASQAPAASDAPADSEAPPASAEPATSADVGSLNTAVVIIGDERYEFTDVQCSIFAPRYIQAGNFGADPEVVIVLPPDGWESQGDTFSPPSVQVTIGDEFAGGNVWLAGDNGAPAITPIPEGSSRIDSYSVPDGRPVTATGTATFFDLAAHNRGEDAPSVGGTFEVTCP
jgi:hypothetical protein